MSNTAEELYVHQAGNIPLYNSKITKNYIEYLKIFHPDIDADAILREAEITTYQLEDGGHWFSQRQVDHFHEILIKRTNNPNLPREVGRFVALSRSSNLVQQFALGLITPAAAYEMVKKLYPQMSRACTLSTRRINSNTVEIIATTNFGVVENQHQCANRMGSLEGLAKAFTNQYAQIEHPECMHKGGSCCRYIVSWLKPPSYLWKKVRNFTLLGSLVLIPSFYFLLPSLSWIMATTFYAFLVMGVALHTAHLEKRELSDIVKKEGGLAENLLEQINATYNSSLLIQEIGQAASSILNIDELLKYVMEVLEKRLDFDRGMIMLANKERSRLVYTAGYGLNATLRKYIEKTEFSLNKPHSRGEFVVTFKEQTPILVDDIGKIEEKLSRRSLDFARKLGSHSFICIPIVYEGKSEGVLAVDNISSKKPFSQSDLSLLMGVAPQLGISINNARAYQVIREREETFRSLAENSPDIIFTLGTDGAYTYINPAWEKILGHPREEVIGKYFIDFAKNEDMGQYVNLFKAIRDKKETIRDYNGILLHTNGTERIFNMNGAPNFDADGTITGVTGTFKDVTKQRTLEMELRQAQKMQAIGTLSGGIAHDFNNILTPIIGYTELLISEVPEESQTKWMLERILNASHRAKDLVQQILTFSRQTEQERKPIQLSLIVKETLRLLRASLPTTIDMRQNIQSTSLVSGDPTQMHQVIMNLCTNASHAMQDESGLLEVGLDDVRLDREFTTLYPTISSGEFIKLTVRDTGHGITPEVMERIFDPFFTTKERSKGTGMGLSVVHGIVENHGGVMSVSSTPGEGSTFTVYLPIIEEEQAAVIDMEETLCSGDERILFIDDELPVVDIGRDILESLGYHVTATTSSTEALELFENKSQEFDLVITDMTMPSITGDVLATKLMSIRPDIPVIICTGYSTRLSRDRANDLGIRDIIMKPIVKTVIAETIRKALKRT